MNYIIEECTPLEDARKDTCVDGTPYTGEEGQLSEWAASYAMSKFKIGQSVTPEELRRAFAEGVTEQAFMSLETKGLVESTWDPETEEIVYRKKL